MTDAQREILFALQALAASRALEHAGLNRGRRLPSRTIRTTPTALRRHR